MAQYRTERELSSRYTVQKLRSKSVSTDTHFCYRYRCVNLFIVTHSH
jgi:hypothetical protein